MGNSANLGHVRLVLNLYSCILGSVSDVVVITDSSVVLPNPAVCVG